MVRHQDVVQSQVKNRDRVRDLAEVHTHKREVDAMLDLVADLIYQFKAFENASLHYADAQGVGELHGKIGLWDTVVDIDDENDEAS